MEVAAEADLARQTAEIQILQEEVAGYTILMARLVRTMVPASSLSHGKEVTHVYPFE